MPTSARVVELVDTLVLGTSAVRREGSSPFPSTIHPSPESSSGFGGLIKCRDGGIGRHAAFRALCPSGRGGSSPLPGTTSKN